MKYFLVILAILVLIALGALVEGNYHIFYKIDVLTPTDSTSHQVGKPEVFNVPVYIPKIETKLIPDTVALRKALKAYTTSLDSIRRALRGSIEAENHTVLPDSFMSIKVFDRDTIKIISAEPLPAFRVELTKHIKTLIREVEVPEHGFYNDVKEWSFITLVAEVVILVGLKLFAVF